MPSFFPVVRTSNGRFVYDDVHLTDEGAFEYWRFNHEGLCLKTLRRLVQLWLEALVGAGGMTKDNTERMMKAVASNYQELVVKLPWVFPDELGGDKAFICTAVDGLPLDIEFTPLNLYTMGEFTFDALRHAGVEPKVHHILSGRYATRSIAGKEVLGIEELWAIDDCAGISPGSNHLSLAPLVVSLTITALHC